MIVLIAVQVANLASDDTKSGNLLGGGDATRMEAAKVFNGLGCKYAINGTVVVDQTPAHLI